MVDFPERMTLESANVTDERLDALRSVFPEVFREGKVDFDALKRSLGENVDSGPERFGLTWPGKAECARVIQTPSVGTLLPMKEESVDWDTTQNVIIEGENLEVLKLLQKAYYGKVKLIYIDPPYNTGNEFVYPDNFKEGLADYLKYSGQVDGEGIKVSANTDTNGRYHSKWLSMMYPRLFLARNLLREDGVIFVSIDDHEFHHLRAIMNEVFGEENFIGSFIWQHSVQPKGYTQTVSVHHNYGLAYSKSETFELVGIGRTDDDNKAYGNADNDPRGPWRLGDLRNALPRPSLRYPVTTPTGVVLEPPPNGWRYSKATLERKIQEGEISFLDGGRRMIRKIYLDTVGDRAVESIWFSKDVGTTRDAAAELKDLFDGETPFDTAKPTALLNRIFEVAQVGAGDVVLDFFSGSGTTADALFRANSKDGLQRNFILVQIPEPLQFSSYETISEICKDRVARASARESTKPGRLGETRLDVGFRTYRLSSSNFLVWDGTSKPAEQLQVGLGALAENVVAGRTQNDLAVELLLKLGFPMNTPMSSEVVAGKTVYSAADGAVMFFLDDRISIEIIEWMVEKDPARIVVLEAAFGGDDELKVNAVQTVRAKAAGKQSEMVLKVV
jgi:adenine-specific DNA-methyltransferase